MKNYMLFKIIDKQGYERALLGYQYDGVMKHIHFCYLFISI